MAYYNYNKEKLVKVGMEGFAIVDECFGGKAARVNAPQRIPPVSPPPTQQILCRYPYQPQESRVYVVTQFPSSTNDVLSAFSDYYEAANKYEGMLIRDYPKRKPMRVA